MPDGELILCPAKPSGIEFLTTNNAWGFIRLKRTPKYLALYVGRPNSAIEFVGEVEKVVEAGSAECPIKSDDPNYEVGKKLVLLKKDRLWALAKPIALGVPMPGKAPQGLRFLQLSKLAKAQTLDDL